MALALEPGIAGNVATAAPPPPSLGASPTSGAPGDTLTVSGTSFAKSTQVTLTWDGTSSDMPTTYTRPNGSFSVGVVIPPVSAGTHSLDASTWNGSAHLTIQVVSALAAPAAATPVPPTATAVPPTAVPPTATAIQPTATAVPPTATRVPPTATRVPPTATAVPPTATAVPPTAVPPTPVPPMATAVSTTSSTPSPTFDFSGEEAQLVDLINQSRAANGVAPVSMEARIMRVAHWRAQDMTNRNYSDHLIPAGACYTNSQGATTCWDHDIYVWDVLSTEGIGGYVGENFWLGPNLGDQQAEVSNQVFYDHPGHHENMLDPTWAYEGNGMAYTPIYNGVNVVEVFCQFNS